MIMALIKCSMDKCIHYMDGDCNCNMIFIDNYGECEMYEKINDKDKEVDKCSRHT